MRINFIIRFPVILEKPKQIKQKYCVPNTKAKSNSIAGPKLGDIRYRDFLKVMLEFKSSQQESKKATNDDILITL
ncbi:unnamed protein product [Paramecium octaurelia]|uniref:Uncharacterized protein n=1 Tax=Paramecium octaurelia TaxID=43137 RepID=A0A8S1SQX7_PAROT|nr:unnamed protein product [Paramecium octaurelia]